MNTHAQSQLKQRDLEEGEKPHLFRLSDDVLESFDMEDVRATYNDMAELGINKDPYPYYAVQVKYKFIQKFSEQARLLVGDRGTAYSDVKDYIWTLIYDTDYDDDRYGCDIYMSFRGQEVDLKAEALRLKIKSHYDVVCKIGEYMRYFLMVVLATRNVEKTIKKNTPRAISPMQRKDSVKYDYTTTIKIGKITESYGASTGLGGRKRPHLRRGHIRTQRFGKGNAEVKKIFIEPVFINADENWINEQKTYRVKT
jgi:hypothetical protein